MDGHPALDEARIEAIVAQVMSELRQGERVRHGPLPEAHVAQPDATRTRPEAPLAGRAVPFAADSEPAGHAGVTEHPLAAATPAAGRASLC